MLFRIPPQKKFEKLSLRCKPFCRLARLYNRTQIIILLIHVPQTSFRRGASRPRVPTRFAAQTIARRAIRAGIASERVPSPSPGGEGGLRRLTEAGGRMRWGIVPCCVGTTVLLIGKPPHPPPAGAPSPQGEGFAGELGCRSVFASVAVSGVPSPSPQGEGCALLQRSE